MISAGGGDGISWNFKVTKKRKRINIALGPETEADKSFAKDLTVGRVALTRYMKSSYMK